MPIFIENFSWRQTVSSIFIRVPLKGVKKSCVDIFMLENFIKVNHPPYLFELFLANAVKHKENKCTIGDNELIFEVHKEEAKEWEHLEMKLSKQEKVEMKKKLVEKSQAEAANKQAIRLERVSEREKLTVNEQIKLETQSRKKIEELQKSERNKAIDDFKQWQQHSIADKENVETNIFSDEDLKDASHSRLHSESNEGDRLKKEIKIVSTSFQSNDSSDQARNKTESVPAVRNCATIEINFTSRVFPTPCRESKLPEEEEWLRKQAAARRASGFVSEDLRPEECDPQWLKEKGDSFFKLGNYLAAVSAYSHGITLSNKMPALYSNRSAAHIALENYHKAAEDASKALELLEPAVEGNRESRAKAHARRGTALCKLGSFKYGLLDFEAALSLMPADDKLRQDVDNLKLQIQNQNDFDIDFDKQ